MRITSVMILNSHIPATEFHKAPENVGVVPIVPLESQNPEIKQVGADMQRVLFATITMCLVLATTTGIAQSTNGTVRGVVRDEAHNIIPGVQVRLRNVETNAVDKTQSNESGEYRFEVPQGEYELTANLPGFKRSKILNLRLNQSGTIQKDLTLTVGQQPRTPLPTTPQGHFFLLVNQTPLEPGR
jgi:hypothetical protein